MKDLLKEYQDDMKKQIIMTALGDDFFRYGWKCFVMNRKYDLH